jgi:adenylylsulfate kinase-like enzyme
LHVKDGLRFVEIFVDAPLAVCEQRDPKGLYKKARAGELKHFTGIDDPYEAPAAPELQIATAETTPMEAAEAVLAYLVERKIVPALPRADRYGGPLPTRRVPAMATATR